MVPIRWVLFWAIVGLIMAVLSTALLREWSRVQFLKETLSQSEEEVKSLTRELERAKERLDFYRTPEGKARLAREQFNLVLPGEKIYKISVQSGDLLRDGLP
nr:septum formation initiator family protein [uncultured Dethiosulfovibrio sp.]